MATRFPIIYESLFARREHILNGEKVTLTGSEADHAAGRDAEGGGMRP